MDRRKRRKEKDEKSFHLDSIFDGNPLEIDKWNEEMIENHIIWLIIISKNNKIDEKTKKVNEIWKRTRLHSNFSRINQYLSIDSSQFLQIIKGEHQIRKRISDSHGFSTEISILTTLMKEGTQSAGKFLYFS